MKKSIVTLVLAVFMVAALLSGCGQSSGNNENTQPQGNQETTEKGNDNVALPQQMTWSVYDVGSKGYTEAAAVADALTKTYGTQIRMLPSGTGVGRMVPMRSGTATYGRLGDEYYFAYEGLYEFASPSWEPQDMRVVWAPVNYYGMAVRKDSGINTLADLKGKKVAYITANPSINVKTEAMLAFGGLTWDDVQKTEIPSYAAQADALKQGKLDAISMVPPASALYEVDSAVGIKWLPIPASDTEGWARLQKVAPWMKPGKDDRGAGLEKGKPQELMAYAYPMVTYAKQSADEVYSLVKAMDATFDKYKSAAPGLADWATDKVNVMPTGVPFHEGTVKFLKEKGLWTDEAEQKNQELIDRFKKIKDAWDTVVQEASEKGIGEKDFADYWMKRKSELVGE